MIQTDLNPSDAAQDIFTMRGYHRTEAARSIAYAESQAKARYDQAHKAIYLKARDKAYLRLHRGYRLPGEPNWKLSNQRCGPFTIKRKVGPLAYELADLPARWKIHPVVSMAQLEPEENAVLSGGTWDHS